ncbi:MAG TPA: ABC transporter substrate-binding protein [Dehalococcoidia bacterium]|nr:ABC transporter substrate-binding protein [Dehalococcoidia bacterium]
MAGAGDYWSAIPVRLNRRRLLLGAVGAGLATSITACGGRQAPTAGNPIAGTAAKPKKGGILVHAGGTTVGSYDTGATQIDPHINTPVAARGFRLVYQGLLGYKMQNYAIEPELAQKWEQPSPTELIFHLQPGVKWHSKPPVNGRALTADDVVFGLNRMRTNDPKFANRSLFANVDKIEAVDSATVKISAKGPDATLLPALSGDPAMVLAPEVVQKFDKFLTAESVAGTGPFVLTYLEEGVRGEYTRNRDYWKPDRPYLDGVRTQHFNDQQAASAAFQAGQLDILLLPGEDVKAYLARQSKGSTPDWVKDEGGYPTATPNTKVKPLDDPRVPKALRLLIDHDEFITGWAESWFGGGRHGAFLCTALDQWDFSHEEYARMLEWKKPKDDAAKEALALLSAAGYTRDNPLTFEIAGGVQNFQAASAQLLQAQWSRLSQGAVKATIRLYDQEGQNVIRANRSFTYFIGGNSGAFNDPDAWFNSIYVSGGSRNYTGFADPSFDEMVKKQRTILDVEQRKAYVKDMIKLLIDKHPGVILVYRQFIDGVKPRVHDYAGEYYLNGRQYEWIWMDS